MEIKNKYDKPPVFRLIGLIFGLVTLLGTLFAVFCLVFNAFSMDTAPFLSWVNDYVANLQGVVSSISGVGDVLYILYIVLFPLTAIIAVLTLLPASLKMLKKTFPAKDANVTGPFVRGVMLYVLSYEHFNVVAAPYDGLKLFVLVLVGCEAALWLYKTLQIPLGCPAELKTERRLVVPFFAAFLASVVAVFFALCMIPSADLTPVFGYEYYLSFLQSGPVYLMLFSVSTIADVGLAISVLLLFATFALHVSAFKAVSVLPAALLKIPVREGYAARAKYFKNTSFKAPFTVAVWMLVVTVLNIIYSLMVDGALPEGYFTSPAFLKTAIAFGAMLVIGIVYGVGIDVSAKRLGTKKE